MSILQADDDPGVYSSITQFDVVVDIPAGCAGEPGRSRGIARRPGPGRGRRRACTTPSKSDWATGTSCAAAGRREARRWGTFTWQRSIGGGADRNWLVIRLPAPLPPWPGLARPVLRRVLRPGLLSAGRRRTRRSKPRRKPGLLGVHLHRRRQQVLPAPALATWSSFHDRDLPSPAPQPTRRGSATRPPWRLKPRTP